LKYELLVDSNGLIQAPLVKDGVTWTTERRGVPGKLAFTVIKDASANFHEGDPVRLAAGGKNLFYGFVFTKKRDREHNVAVTAYDQTRYLLNKDTIDYKNKTASAVIRDIAETYRLQLGEIAQTGFNIAQRTEENKTLLDMIYNALDLELTNRKRMYIFYDDYGKLALRLLDDMKLDLLIDEGAGQNFDYTSSIDDQTYNRVKLSFENEGTGKRDIYVEQSGENINRWGILQYYDTLREGENGPQKAAALLDLYSAKTRKLKVTKAFGDTRVRAGSMPIVKLALGDMSVQCYMVVEKCAHTLNESEHWMDLTLRGSEFNA